jgi:glucose/arabinose dehydrogenase
MKISYRHLIIAALSISASATAADGFTYEEKFTDVTDVWDFAFPGGSNSGLITVSRCGDLTYIALDGTKTELGDVTQHVECKQQQAGVTGLTFDRDFAESGYAYLYYTVKGQIASAVARVPITRDGDTFEVNTGGFDTIIEGLPFATNNARNSGGLAIDTAGTHLFVATGDNNTINQAKLAQDITAYHGKLLRYRIDGSVPSDNPSFGSEPGALKAIYAIGFGRPYRIGLDTVTGGIFVADSARLSWSEVSLIPEGGGGNYGWPEIEGDGHTGPGGVDPIVNPITPIFETQKPSPGSLLVVGTPYRRPESAEGGLPEPLHGYVPVAEFYEPWFKLVGPNGEVVETNPGLSGPRSIATGPDGEFWVLEAQKNVISRLVWADEPPQITMDEPAETVRYRGEETLNLVASGIDPEDGLNVSGFKWTITLYDGKGDVIEELTQSGQTGTYDLPTEIDIEGKLELTVSGQDTIGNVGTATRTLVPDASRITFNSDPPGVPFEVDGEDITEEIERVYEPNTPIAVVCPFEYTFADDPDSVLYVFLSRTDDKGSDETFVVPSEDFVMTCKYRRFDEPVVADDVTEVEPVVIDLGGNEPSPSTASDDGCTNQPGEPVAPLGLFLLISLCIVTLRARRA